MRQEEKREPVMLTEREQETVILALRQRRDLLEEGIELELTYLSDDCLDRDEIDRLLDELGGGLR